MAHIWLKAESQAERLSFKLQEGTLNEPLAHLGFVAENDLILTPALSWSTFMPLVKTGQIAGSFQKFQPSIC